MNTISSDHAAIINKDLSRLDNRLDFLMNLSEYNSKKIAAEEELTRDQITRVNLDLWRNLIIDNPEISVYIPTGLVNVLSSNASDESKLIEIESLFFEHNKNNKIEAIDSILSLIRTTNADGTVQTIDSSKNTKINKDTTYGQLSNYSKAIYFATVLSTRADDYYRRQLMSLEGQLNKAPFYTQELAAKILEKANKLRLENLADINELSGQMASADREQYISLTQERESTEALIRELENMNRIPKEQGGDLYLVGGSMKMLGETGSTSEEDKNKEEKV